MAQEQIKVEGTVLKDHGHGRYVVELGNSHLVKCTLGSNLQSRQGKVKPPKVLPMDIVLIVLSSMDLTRGRITELITQRK